MLMRGGRREVRGQAESRPGGPEMKARARVGGGRVGRQQGEWQEGFCLILFLLTNTALSLICPIWFQL